MKIELQPGERVSVTFAGSDGEITVKFDTDAIRVEADLPDSTGREGTIYEEKYGHDLDSDGFKVVASEFGGFPTISE